MLKSKLSVAENKAGTQILMEGATILLFCLLFVHQSYTAELDTISDTSFLTNGDTLVSAAGIFELGFFKPGSSENTYLGIWYKKISDKTVVWVANRYQPVRGASRLELKIADRGILGLFSNDSMTWSCNTTASGNITAKLRDNGNLVLIDQQERVLWQSFDYPTDTFLPGMKLGRDYVRRKEWHLSSWKSSDDPAPGEVTLAVDTPGYPEFKLRQGGALIKYRAGPWRNKMYPWGTVLNKSLTFRVVVIINAGEESLGYSIEDSSILARVTVNSTVHMDISVWVNNAGGWISLLSVPTDARNTYNMCGAYGICSIDAYQQSCNCMDKKSFVPKNQKDWDTGDRSGGCIRRTQLECKKGLEGFIKYSNVSLPDTKTTWFNMNMTLEECHKKCLQNCTCMAYANPDSTRRICLLWFNDLLDLQLGGADIFVRMASSELDFQSISGKKQDGSNKIKIILLVIIPGVLLIGLIIATWFCYARRKRNPTKPAGEGKIMKASKSQEEEDIEQAIFSFSTIANATENFSPVNKLGEGGFGPVYKGMLEEGQEIAVKRLSKNSSQGHDEFKNEVICISKLQHRNLVKILGCCIEGDEKLLVYEYMPNKSLDSFIFDKTQSTLLDWTKRFNIIKGIARGLVYLHQDSRLRIIHRDLKASNILLDQDMNPKISDFGLARSFGGNETQANTERVVGTYGYMSPEYALDGLFSIKSDVFSFGVLVLEIVSGKRNRGFVRSEKETNFIAHVWSLYNEGRSMDLVDLSCSESCHPDEVLRSIKVGLLCVQHNAADRPQMSSVILMLAGEGEPPQPKQPSFFMERQHVENFSSSTNTEGSSKDCTISEVYAR
ncbi:putative protein kinase RLK-Pelle-DLSV family [Helianthus annuus]|nr:putative protein kinase RLK-Pelle-DLSV family [Helianthus annuus]